LISKPKKFFFLYFERTDTKSSLNITFVMIIRFFLFWSSCLSIYKQDLLVKWATSVNPWILIGDSFVRPNFTDTNNFQCIFDDKIFPIEEIFLSVDAEDLFSSCSLLKHKNFLTNMLLIQDPLNILYFQNPKFSKF